MSFLRRSSSPRTSPSIFPFYFLPSIPFRRRSRHSSTSTDASTSTTASTDSPTPTPANPTPFLSGHTSHLRCAKCNTDLCLTSQIISKGFTGRHGRAYLVQGQPSHTRLHHPSPPSALPNTYQNKAVPRQLVTGHHTVSDISCAVCGTVLGWKYVAAEEESQWYKVGKFILETKRIRGAVDWESGAKGVKSPFQEVGEAVDFDSQDEDECEDLFAGVWSPELAVRRRRRGRRFARNTGAGEGEDRARSEDMW